MHKNKFTWENNSFWKGIKERLEKTWSVFSGLPMSVEGGVWTQNCSDHKASQLALLQNRYIAVDVTDRGFGTCPMIQNGRYYGRVGFEIEYENKILSIGDWDIADPDKKIREIKAKYELDSFTVTGTAFDGLTFEIKTGLPASFPFIITNLELRSHSVGKVVIKPWMLCPVEDGILENDDVIWMKPMNFPLIDKVLSNNNSATADPPRKEEGSPTGIGIAYENRKIDLWSYKKLDITHGRFLTLCDRTLDGNSVKIIHFNPIQADIAGGNASLSLILGMCTDVDEFKNALQKWRKFTEAAKKQEIHYWSGICDKLSIKSPYSDINTQAGYSVKNSLSSRSIYDGDKEIFIHGRPDRGYGDCSKLHQSYQMYFVALAAGEAESVKKELRSYARLQPANGDMAIQLRPGNGYHAYAGLYSNAHFIMASYRYLCWTGDIDFINEVIDTAKRSADWLLKNRSDGLIRPCGWLDAWPPKVKAQAQISIVTFIALKELSQIFGYADRPLEKEYYYREAFLLSKRIKDVFFNPRNGLFAEHLFESGKVEGGETEDFWVHTQIWAALAGIAPDIRGLEACRRYCLKNGMTVIPEGSLETDYICDSTDGLEDLDLGSTATWLLAVWPELTHLYAIAEIKYGRISLALDAVCRQLPENVHYKNPYAPPYFYAEKYLYPYDIPWLCTWSGDPTLIQVLLEGFGGVHAIPNGLIIKPNIPDKWKEKRYRMNFIWRGYPINLTVRKDSEKTGNLEINGRKYDLDITIVPEMLRKDMENKIVINS